MTETLMPGFRKGRQCAVCESPVSDRGRDSKTGEYFCSKNLCRLERDARRQKRYRESRPTSAALAALPTREELRQRMLDEGLTQEQVDDLIPPRLR